MSAGSQMMHQMITIIPAFCIVRSIDAGIAIAVHVFRVIRIHKCMLCPVAKHHHQSRKKKRDYQDPQRSLQVDKAHYNTKSKKSSFTISEAHVIFFLLFINEIHEGFFETKKNK